VAKFKFRLASLKKYRETRLLMARKELIQVESQIFELQQDARRAAGNRADLLHEGNGNISLAMRQLNADLVATETQRIGRLEKELLRLEEERARHARWVVHLGRELKAIEKLEERKREAFESEQRLAEKRTMDNWVAEHWGRGDRGEGAA
jgi:flagellar export protein FliJ